MSERAVFKRDWVDCPICGEPDMARTWRADEDDGPYIDCVNISCPSNTGVFKEHVCSQTRIPRQTLVIIRVIMILALMAFTAVMAIFHQQVWAVIGFIMAIIASVAPVKFDDEKDEK